MNAKEFYMSKPWVKHYPEGATAIVDIPEGMSAPDMIEKAVSLYGKKPALIFYGREISYNELKELVDRFATALADMGIKKGDTIALYLLNCPQYIISYFAALKLGAKITPISPVYTSH
jgi:long-chain acyl-CoA synthetase